MSGTHHGAVPRSTAISGAPASLRRPGRGRRRRVRRARRPHCTGRGRFGAVEAPNNVSAEPFVVVDGGSAEQRRTVLNAADRYL